MKQQTQGLYPNNLWIYTFGEEFPVPEDAEETLDYLLDRSVANERHRKVIQFRFKENMSISEIADNLGVSTSNAQKIVSRIGRILRDANRQAPRGTLIHGLRVYHELADGRASLCCVCGKAIFPSDPVYVVPHGLEDMGYLRKSMGLCCSMACVKDALETGISYWQKQIALHESHIRTCNEAVSLLTEFQSEQTTLEKGRNIVREAKAAHLKSKEEDIPGN